MQQKFEYIKRMWNNQAASDEEALDWIIAHAEALSKRLKPYLLKENGIENRE